jgi:hypothetical protein
MKTAATWSAAHYLASLTQDDPRPWIIICCEDNALHRDDPAWYEFGGDAQVPMVTMSDPVYDAYCQILGEPNTLVRPNV